MRWRTGRRSENVQDYRGRRIGGGLGIGGAVLALILAYFFGVDPRLVTGLLGGGTQTTQVEPGVRKTGSPTDELADFVSVVLPDTEDVWTERFAAEGAQYQPPTLILFEGQVNSACGMAGAAMGPFYCPADQRVYIDLSFYRDLVNMGAAGDFAQAYVIAHEVGHHVQNLIGTSGQVQAQRQSASEQDANAMSVRLELQADCYSGVWAHHAERTRQILEQGDVEEALGAAAAVGDDTLQRRGRGAVVPESFTHGSAEQRQRWFGQGLSSGSASSCDTFSARQL